MKDEVVSKVPIGNLTGTRRDIREWTYKIATIKVWRIADNWHPCPWMFSVTVGDTEHLFAGIPNQCKSVPSAYVRALWRARWLLDGSFKRRYVGGV